MTHTSSVETARAPKRQLVRKLVRVPARAGSMRFSLFHHFCYDKYCKEILKKVLHDEENCNLCMDCKGPQTVDAAGSSGSAQVPKDVAGSSGSAQPPKRGARGKK